VERDLSPTAIDKRPSTEMAALPCQSVVLSSNAATFNKLCLVCERLFSKVRTEHISYQCFQFYNTAALLRSASEGCHFCNLLVYADPENGHFRDTPLKIEYADLGLNPLLAETRYFKNRGLSFLLWRDKTRTDPLANIDLSYKTPFGE